MKKKKKFLKRKTEKPKKKIEKQVKPTKRAKKFPVKLKKLPPITPLTRLIKKPEKEEEETLEKEEKQTIGKEEEETLEKEEKQTIGKEEEEKINERKEKLEATMRELSSKTEDLSPVVSQVKKKEKSGQQELKKIGINLNLKKEKIEVKKIEKEERQELIKQPTKQGVLEKYSIEVDKARVKVEIKKDISGITYNLYAPEIGVATASLLEEIRNKLVAVTTISMKEILDPDALKDIKKRFMEEASKLLVAKLPAINPETKEFLIGKLMQDMLGLGEIEFLVNDPNLEEVVIPSSKETIRIYHKKYGWLLTNLKIAKEEEIVNYSNIIARRVGKQITVLTPLLDAHLITGDRVNAILYPVATKGNTITIRKFARDPYTIIDLINNKTCDLETAVLLWLAIEYEMNVLISGGTASGKTVLLNSCMPFIPPNHRIISVEDTRELMLPDFLYWCPLVTRTPNPEGKGEVSMLDLLINSLRMRPDRIVLGEMRRQREAEVLFEAMHTGHSVYATVHADTAAETVSRLTNPPLNVPPNLLKGVNLNVVMFRDRRKGIRRVLQIAEFEAIKDRAEANIIYRWVPEEDKIVKHSESSRFFEDISRNTGMNQAELNKNLDEKKKVLSWLVKNNIRDLNDFGRVMNLYYSNKEMLMKAIQENDVKGVVGR